MSNDNPNQLARTQGAGMTTTREGFDESSVDMTGETSSSALAARVTAVAQAKFIMAMKRPRDMDDVRVKMLRACERPGAAGHLTEKVWGSYWYKKPVGDGVEGFSIRFAEEAIRCLGNIDVQTITLWDDPRKRIVEVTVLDLENNISYPTSITLEKTVERKKLGKGQIAIRQRPNSYGETLYIVEATDDEVFMKQQNLISKAIRNGALRLLPGDIQAECQKRIMAIRFGEAAKDPDGFKRKVLDSFATLNIMPAQLAEYVGHDLNLCTPAELTGLRDLHADIKEGKTTWVKALAEALGEEDQERKDEPKAPVTTTAQATDALRDRNERAQLEKQRSEAEANARKAEADAAKQPGPTHVADGSLPADVVAALEGKPAPAKAPKAEKKKDEDPTQSPLFLRMQQRAAAAAAKAEVNPDAEDAGDDK